MSEKNPYENQESVEIPDFPSIKDEDDIDRSKFKLDEEEYDDEEYYDDEPKTRVVKRSVIVLTIVLLVLLLGLSTFGIVFGLSKNKAYNTISAEYEEYKNKAISNETALNAKIVELEAKIAEQEAVVVTDEPVVYVVKADAGLRVRKDAKVDGDNFADFESLSANVKKQCAKDGDAVVVYNGAEFEVSEVKKNGTATWGKIDANAWICLNDGTTDFCVKK